MKRFVAIVMAAVQMCSPLTAQAVPKTRTMTGVYYDYMTIVTKDGNEWLLSDAQKKSNPYMKKETVIYKGKKRKEYVPIFKSGQKVAVKFDTNGTKKKTDDKIVSVKIVKK